MKSRLALLGGDKVRTEPFAAAGCFGNEEKLALEAVIDSKMLSGFIAKAGDYFLGGEFVKQLESDVCRYFGSAYAIGCNSATAGLHMAVAACNLGPGDEVITSPYTMSATATSILMQNAVPVFADIEEDMFCLSPESIEKVITPLTKAIIVVHLFGQSADMDSIMAIARKHNLSVIEDCAQAPGAKYKGRYVGTIGDLGIFSLNQHKTITTGEGGVVITNNKKLADKARLVRNHGEVIVADMQPDDIVNTLGWNYRMTELEAAVGVEQFKKLDRLNKTRVSLAGYLAEKLKEFNFLIPPIIRKGSTHVFFNFPMRYRSSSLGVSRELFVKAMQAEGVPLAAGYVRPIYLEPAYQKKIGYGDKGCPFRCPWYKGAVSYEKGISPVAERLYHEELLITNICRYPLKKSDVNDFVKAVEKIAMNVTQLKGM